METPPITKNRGATRMREQGYKLVQVWLDPSELAMITDAVKRQGTPLATFIRRSAFEAASELLFAMQNANTDRIRAEVLTPEEWDRLDEIEGRESACKDSGIG